MVVQRLGFLLTKKLSKPKTSYCGDIIINGSSYCWYIQGLLVMAGNVTNQQALPMTVGFPTANLASSINSI